VIDHGNIVASDTAENLKAQVAGDLIDLEIENHDMLSVAAGKLAAIGDEIEVDGAHVRGRVVRSGAAVPGLLRELDRADVTLNSIEVRRPTLDDVFLDLTGRSLRDDTEVGVSA